MENQVKINSEVSLPKRKLKGVIQLFKESFKIYCSKIKTLLGIMGVWVGFSFIGLVLLNFLGNTNLKYSFWFSLLVFFYYLISFFLWAWAILSLIYNLKENTGFKESYQKSWKILISFIWIYFLFSAITIGGFLLLIIPGILFLVWFSLAFFVLIFEERRGFESLFRSKHLISGKFFSVFWRILAPILILFIIALLIFLPISLSEGLSELRKTQINEIIGYLLQLFIAPFFLIYLSLIYKDLKEIKTEIPYSPSSKIRKLKYLLPAILGALVIGLLISLFLLHIFLGRDEMPIDDSDLRLKRIEIQNEDKDNAFYYLAPYFQISDWEKEEIISKYWPEGKEKLKEEKEIYWPDEKVELIDNIIQGKEWDEEFVKEFLKKNEGALNDFEIAIDFPYFQNPIYRDPEKFDISLPLVSISVMRTMARLNLIEATYFFNQGKEKEAFEQAFKVIKLGHMLQEAPQPAFIDYLVGMAIKKMASQKIRVMLKDTNLNSSELKNYAERFNEFTKKGEGLTKIFKVEYVMLSNTKARLIDPIFIGQVPKKNLKEELGELGFEEILIKVKPFTGLNFLYKPNQTQRLFAEHFRAQIQGKPLEIPRYPLDPSDKLFIENFIGKVLYNISAVSLSGVLGRKKEQDFSLLASQLLMAIKAYKIKNGKLPSNLEELVPEYISEIPKDPFGGEPIKYSAEKKIIYSVGSDGKDSGGSEGEDWQKMADPTFKIEF